jgi:aspartate carbamoyltransferase catalytic subunit
MTTSIKLKHLLRIEDLSDKELMGLLTVAEEYKAKTRSFKLDKQVTACNMFFENSTRTHRSFEMAQRKLGLDVIQFDASTSSTSKGESLYDTILTMSAIGIDVCVIRHNQDEYYKQLVESPSITCSIINGGDGKGQHPTQCLLDLMTIYEEFKTFKGLKIAIVGDIRNSRVARSNAIMLKRLNAELYFCGPQQWLDPAFDEYGQRTELDKIIDKMDVVMLLRVQHERHHEETSFSKEEYHQEFGLTLERAKKMKPSAIIMHPAPVNRDVELADALVESKASRIVTQMTNGVYIRMAVLEAILAYRSNL